VGSCAFKMKISYQTSIIAIFHLMFIVSYTDEVLSPLTVDLPSKVNLVLPIAVFIYM